MNTAITTPSASTAAQTLARVDRWCERIGDAINPILVKEARQALKSRQFVFTFSTLLLAALGWTIIGSLSMMPQIYTSPSAGRMLIGYYFVLAVPMLMVVPVAAYRSLEAEIDDGTLELLSISALSPWQIVLGKLYSAMLQMMLYFVALFPCVAYAYNLRGVDLPTTLLILGMLLVAGVMLTIFALFLAANASSRTGRITSLFVVMAAVVAAQVSLGSTVVGLINFGNPLTFDQLFCAVTGTVVLSLCLGHLFMATAAAHLTPASENRSTTLRVSLMVTSAAAVAVAVLAAATVEMDFAGLTIMLVACGLALLWAVAGSMMVAESPAQTPRISRELPHSFLARMLLTWLTPGPASGLVFAVINIGLLTAAGCIALQFMATPAGFPPRSVAIVQNLLLAYAAYCTGFIVLTRMVVVVIRAYANPRAEIGAVVFILILVLSALVPYSVGVHLNDYRDYDDARWQISNWAWTFAEIFDGYRANIVLAIVGGVSLLGFCVCLVWTSDITLPRRTATPDRVRLEQERQER